MSVTFYLDATQTGFTVGCVHGGDHIPEIGEAGYQKALAALAALRSGERTWDCPNNDEYCAADPMIEATFDTTGTDSALEVNMTNDNAAMVLSTLGLVEESEDGPETMMVGEETAEQFLGRVLLAIAVSPVDAGVPATDNGNMTHCGRVPSYLQSRLSELHDLAATGMRVGRKVVWS